MIRILLDTNVAVYVFDRKLDIDSMVDSAVDDAHSLCILDACVRELKSLGRNDVVVFLEKKGVKIVSAVSEKGKVDDLILDEASSNGLFLMSEDKELLARARARKIRTVTLDRYNIKVV